MVERDYIERTIATIRRHPKEAEWWTAAGHNLADYIAALEAELAAAREALREVHDYNCGCDTPGQLDRCVAQPVVVFAALSEGAPGG